MVPGHGVLADSQTTRITVLAAFQNELSVHAALGCPDCALDDKKQESRRMRLFM